MSFKVPSSHSTGSATFAQPSSRRRRPGSSVYRVLSEDELRVVREKLKHLDELHKATKEPYQREMLRMQYKAEHSKELASNLAKMNGTIGKQRKELENRNTDLQRKMADLNRLSLLNRSLSSEKESLAEELRASKAKVAKLEEEAKGLKRRLEQKTSELQRVSSKQRKTKEAVRKVISTLEEL